MKKLLLLFCFSSFLVLSYAQSTIESPNRKAEKKAARQQMINDLIKQEEEGAIIFNKQNTFGVRLNSDGYGIRYEHMRFKTNTRAFLFQVELNEKKHPKEKKLSYSDGAYNYTTLIYGKMNNNYQLNLGIGQQHLIGGKGNKNGVAVSGVYVGGLVLGLEKPYLIDVVDSSNRRFVSQYPELIDKGYYEVGHAGFGQGWGDINVNPGAYVQAGLRFDYGRYNEVVGAVEAGIKAEYYSKGMAQMAYVEPKNFFFSGYITLIFGKRK